MHLYWIYYIVAAKADLIRCILLITVQFVDHVSVTGVKLQSRWSHESPMFKHSDKITWYYSCRCGVSVHENMQDVRLKYGLTVLYVHRTFHFQWNTVSSACKYKHTIKLFTLVIFTSDIGSRVLSVISGTHQFIMDSSFPGTGFSLFPERLSVCRQKAYTKTELQIKNPRWRTAVIL